MTRLHATFWIGLLLMAILSLYLLHDILMPFVIGFALAYFLDPAADRLEGFGLPRSLASLIVLFIFLIVIVVIALAFWPILASQAESFIKNLPGLLDKAGSTILPLFERIMARFQAAANSAGDVSAQSASPLSGLTTQAGQWLVGFASGVLTRGMALFNLLALLFVTPVVAFFLLRDWDIIVARINSWLPRAYAPAIRARANEIDHVLSGYLRGQATVALVMAILYGIGWTIVGLHYSLLLAIVAGFLAFVPYVGAAITVTLALAIGIGQFWPDYVHVGLVFLVYVVTQSIEGNFVTPYLVGDRVGLSPLWVIFAMMAGGTLLGILGIILAVPVAAIVGVLLRAGLDRYRNSRLYDPEMPLPEKEPGETPQ